MVCVAMEGSDRPEIQAHMHMGPRISDGWPSSTTIILFLANLAKRTMLFIALVSAENYGTYLQLET